jgi:hypothetical protein
MTRKLIQELRDALSMAIHLRSQMLTDEIECCRTALRKADAALSQPINHANYCARYEDVCAEFAASKFESPAHRLDAMANAIVELRASLSALAEDAARLKWLLDVWWFGDAPMEHKVALRQAMTRAEVIAAIDAARQSAGTEKG